VSTLDGWWVISDGARVEFCPTADILLDSVSFWYSRSANLKIRHGFITERAYDLWGGAPECDFS
jgi:hypothetical protein